MEHHLEDFDLRTEGITSVDASNRTFALHDAGVLFDAEDTAAFNVDDPHSIPHHELSNILGHSIHV